MVKVIIFALVAGVLVAGAHAQTAVKVGDIANVNVAPNGQTSVVAPGAKVKVDPTKDVKVAAGTPANGSVTVSGPAADAKKNVSAAVDVNVGGAVKVDVKKSPEKSMTGPAAAAASTTAKPAKPDMPAKTPEKSMTAAQSDKPAPAKPGVDVAVDVSGTKPAVDVKKAGEMTSVKVDKAANVQVDVKAGSAGTNGTSTSTTVSTPAKTTVATSSSGNTQVKSPGADVTVAKPPGGGQPTTTVKTMSGVDVQNSPQGTTVSNIPYVGTVTAPGGGRKMLRAW